MKLSKRLAVVTSTVMMSSGLFALTPSPAGACPAVPFYGLTSSSVRVPFNGIPRFKDGPGGKITVSRKKNKTVTYQVVAGAESEVGAVLAKAKVSVSASLTKSQSTEVVHSYEHKIPKGKYGNVRYVSWGKKIRWKKYRYNSSCKQILIRKGTINFPRQAEGWYYWTTKK